MTLYGLRLLVALLTFAVGTAAAWLLNFESPNRSAAAVGVSEYAPVSVITSREESRRSCSFNKSRVVEGGVLQTKTIDKLSPAYPHYGKTARVSGKVTVKVEVDEDGRVSKAKAMTGYGMLPEAAEKDALETRFEPRRLSGQPARVAGVIVYDFVLD